MTDLPDVSDKCRVRTAEMRELARGIYDPDQRASFLVFIDDYERLARALNATDIRALFARS